MKFDLICMCPVCEDEVTDGWEGKHLGMIVEKYMCSICGTSFMRDVDGRISYR